MDSVGPQLIARSRAFKPAPNLAHPTERAVSNYAAIACYLKISVTDNGRSVVSVAMPAGQASILEELVPEDVLEKLCRAGIDVKVIQQEACASGLKPQELFKLRDDSRLYRVWLE